MQKEENDGLVVRFLPMFYDKSHVKAKSYSEGEIISHTAFLAKMYTLLESLFTKTLELPYPQYISMDEESYELFMQFQDENKMNSVHQNNNDNKILLSFYSKLHGIACRFAGILAIIQCGFNDEIVITGETAKIAIEIAKSIIPHAEYAYLKKRPIRMNHLPRPRSKS
jgi:hypothetical protein